MADQLVLTIADLVRSPALQLRVIAGESGLDRQVSWAHVSELDDPTPWLSGAELIMTTGLAIPRSGTAQAEYVERLDDAGVAGLAVSDQLHVPPLRKSFFEAADRRGIPVLRVPLPVPFIAIAQEVAAALQSDMHRRLTAQLHVFGALRTLATEDLSVSELFARLERLSGYSLYLSTRSGRPLLPGAPVPPLESIKLLPKSYDSPPSLPGGYVLPVPAPDGPAGFLLALEQPGVVPAGLAVVQHIATIAGLQVSSLRHEQETLRREGAETLAELLQGVLDPVTAQRRLARVGFGDHQPMRLVVARVADVNKPLDDQDLLRQLDRSEYPLLVLRQQRDLVVLVPDELDVAATLGSRQGLAVGVSRLLFPGDPLAVSRREAMWAVSRALDAGGGVVSFGQDAAGRWLAEDRDSLQALVDGVLGKVLDYDDGNDGTIVPTVRTWLVHNRSNQKAALSLHIHPNTLAYRLRRFETLSGRSLQSTADLAEVWLAMNVVTHVASSPSEPSRP